LIFQAAITGQYAFQFKSYKATSWSLSTPHWISRFLGGSTPHKIRRFLNDDTSEEEQLQVQLWSLGPLELKDAIWDSNDWAPRLPVLHIAMMSLKTTYLLRVKPPFPEIQGAGSGEFPQRIVFSKPEVYKLLPGIPTKLGDPPGECTSWKTGILTFGEVEDREDFQANLNYFHKVWGQRQKHQFARYREH